MGRELRQPWGCMGISMPIDGPWTRGWQRSDHKSTRTQTKFAHAYSPATLSTEAANRDRLKTQVIYAPQPSAHTTAKSYYKSATGQDSRESRRRGGAEGGMTGPTESLDFDGEEIMRPKTYQPAIRDMLGGSTTTKNAVKERGPSAAQSTWGIGVKDNNGQPNDPNQPGNVNGHGQRQPATSEMILEGYQGHMAPRVLESTDLGGDGF